jgi:nucleoside-diphosphate-sugar epimerase
MRGDATKARERVGYEPKTSLQDGLAATIEWYRTEIASGRTSFALASW